jgi:pilus assembly protein Flp/PilA
MSRIRRFLNDSSAATTVEYAVMLALILVAILGSVTTMSQNTANCFNSTASKLQDVGFGH